MESDPALALKYISSQIANATDMKSQTALSSAYLLQGYIFSKFLDAPEKAINSYLKALENLSKENVSLKFQVLNNLGKIYYQYSFYEAASEIYSEGILLAQSINDMDEEISFTKFLGLCYLKLGNRAQAAEMFSRGKTLSSLVGDHYHIYEFDILSSRLQSLFKDYDSSIRNLQSLLDKGEDLNPGLRIQILNNLGYALLQTGKIKEASEVMEQCHSLSQSQNLISPVTLNNMGMLYLAMGNLTTSKSYFIKSTSLSKGMPGDENLIEAYSGLAKVYRREGNLPASETYQQMIIENLKPLIQGADRMRSLASKYSLWKSSNEISDEMKILSSSKDQIRNAVFVVLIFMVTAIISTALVTQSQLSKFRKILILERNATFASIERTLTMSTMVKKVDG